MQVPDLRTHYAMKGLSIAPTLFQRELELSSWTEGILVPYQSAPLGPYAQEEAFVTVSPYPEKVFSELIPYKCIDYQYFGAWRPQRYKTRLGIHQEAKLPPDRNRHLFQRPNPCGAVLRKAGER
jgi:hypothetical protein